MPGLAQKPGGILVVGGPPFGGKSLLANQLAECLPGAIKLESVDNLANCKELWYPNGPVNAPVERPAGKMLTAAQSIWWTRADKRPPTLILSARFETVFMRRRACTLARRHFHTRFLFVEARSSNVRALRNLAQRVLEPASLEQRIARYEKAIKRYQPIDGEEAKRLPCVRLSQVTLDLDAALNRVLRAWQRQS